MHILTLELHDVTVSQAVLELHAALAGHSGPLDVHLGRDEMIGSNLVKLCERQGRSVEVQRRSGEMTLRVAALERTPVPPAPGPVAVPVLTPLPGVQVPAPPGGASGQGVLLTRASLGAGDTMIGRRMVLGVLEALPEATPQLVLALDAVGLLEDPQALRVLARLVKRGIQVGVCRESLMFLGDEAPGFEVVPDGAWHRGLAEGRLRLLA